MFIIKDKLPYYVSSDYTKMYPCKVTAYEYTVDFDSGEDVEEKLDAVMTINEIRQRLGIYVVKGKKVSNKKVTSTTPIRAPQGRQVYDTSKFVI